MHVPPVGVAATTNCNAGSCFYWPLSFDNLLDKRR